MMSSMESGNHVSWSNFSRHLGIEQVSLDAARAVYRMPVLEQHANRNGVLHGGALMSLVDQVAGSLAFANCPPGSTNVTLEAKTNFFRFARVGDVVTAVAVPLHAGRTTVVAQVTTTRGDGKELSATMQTQLFIRWDGDPADAPTQG